MQTVRTMLTGRRRGRAAALLARAAVVAGCALLVCACSSPGQIAGVPPEPVDYRMRHPITLTESNRTFELFIGTNRATLTPVQRAELLAFAQSWRHEATGGVIIDLPIGSSNEHAAHDAMREITSILSASGVPPQNVAVHDYPVSQIKLATVRISYPKITADAGPCGLWPKDIGPSLTGDYFENQPHWNLGCASQRNLAAMVDNPADLVQPRGETPAYTPRRTVVIDKYRNGQYTGTTYPNANAAKISNLGQ